MFTLEKDDKISFDDKTNANTFNEFFCNLAIGLVGTSSVCNYYQNILDLPPSKFKFLTVPEDFVLKLLKDMNEDKAPGINNLSGKFLKDRANIQAKPISKICNLSIKYSDCQIAKLKPLFKQDSTTLL